jgi:hypothetical protein
MTEEDLKALEAYRTEVDALFFLCYEVRWQGHVLKDAVPIVIYKAEVTPEVRPNPTLSLDDVQVLINSTFEKQAKSSDELTCRLIEERDGKNLQILMCILLLLVLLLILLKPILNQVAHRWAAQHSRTHQPSRWTTFIAEPPLMVQLLLLECRSRVGLVCLGKGTRMQHLTSWC